jgi:hypothetical protein
MTDSAQIPGAAEEGPSRFRIGRSQVAMCNRRWIGLLVLGVIVLPWLPIFRPPSGTMPTKRAPGVGDALTLALAFAPDGRSLASGGMRDQMILIWDPLFASRCAALQGLIRDAEPDLPRARWFLRCHRDPRRNRWQGDFSPARAGCPPAGPLPRSPRPPRRKCLRWPAEPSSLSWPTARTLMPG